MTKSLEDYIEEIHLLIRDNGQARSTTWIPAP